MPLSYGSGRLRRHNMIHAYRIVVTFGANSLDSLKKIQKRGEFSSISAAVREAVLLSEVLQEQAGNGFTEVILRNTKTNKEKMLEIPSLRRIAKKAT